MKNWRGTLTTILRSAGGRAHLSEIYPQVEILGENLGQEWKAVARGNLVFMRDLWEFMTKYFHEYEITFFCFNLNL